MTVWLIIGCVVALVLLLVEREVRVYRRTRLKGNASAFVTSSAWPRSRTIDVIELDWSEPRNRKRLGGLGQ